MWVFVFVCEQFQCVTQTHKTDVWMLLVTFWEILNSPRRPYSELYAGAPDEQVRFCCPCSCCAFVSYFVLMLLCFRSSLCAQTATRIVMNHVVNGVEPALTFTCEQCPELATTLQNALQRDPKQRPSASKLLDKLVAIRDKYCKEPLSATSVAAPLPRSPALPPTRTLSSHPRTAYDTWVSPDATVPSTPLPAQIHITLPSNATDASTATSSLELPALVLPPAAAGSTELSPSITRFHQRRSALTGSSDTKHQPADREVRLSAEPPVRMPTSATRVQTREHPPSPIAFVFVPVPSPSTASDAHVPQPGNRISQTEDADTDGWSYQSDSESDAPTNLNSSPRLSPLIVSASVSSTGPSSAVQSDQGVACDQCHRLLRASDSAFCPHCRHSGISRDLRLRFEPVAFHD